MKLPKTSFYHSNLRKVDFTETDLREATLEQCDLTDATFDHTNLTKADFRKSIGYKIDPNQNQVKGAKFSIPEVVGLLHTYGIKIY